MSYYYCLPERVEETGHGKAVDETELCANAKGRPSVFVQGSSHNISGEKKVISIKGGSCTV